MNFLEGHVTGSDRVEAGGSGLTLRLPSSCKPGDKVTLGVRPEHMNLGAATGPLLQAQVDLIERLGETGYAHLRLPTGQVVISEVRGEPGHVTGDSISVGFDPVRCHIFDAAGRRIE